MDDPSPSPPPPPPLKGRLRRNAVEEDDGGEGKACTGQSCQSCMAGAIADCVALCCCPCAVVNFFVLTVFKLPWSVARKWVLRRRRRKRKRRMLEETKYGGITDKIMADGGMLEIVVSGEEAEDYISAEELWLKLSEIGHLGFGRVSSARMNFYTKGN